MPAITKSLIDKSLACDTDQWIWDTELKGFGVRIQPKPSGRKTYVIRYRNQQHQQRKCTVGRCSDLTPDQARALARKSFARIADGKDPAAEKQSTREAPTLTDLKERYMREHAKPFKKASSCKEDQRLWDKTILPLWGKKTIESITRADILSLHGSLVETQAKANHTLALLSKAFNLAELWGWRTTLNPCRGVKKYVIHARDNVLSSADVAKLIATAEELAANGEIPVPMSNLVRLLLLTGCRLNEVMSARQEWVDHENKLLRLPDSKVGQRQIPLSDAALEIIRTIPAGTWLIPGRVHGEHMTHPWKMLDRVCQHAGVKRVRPHDLRHTVGSLGHRAGLSQREIARLLGHRQLATTERYMHGIAGDEVRSVDIVANIVRPARVPDPVPA